ncbi:exocyst complex subunit 2 [Cavenderia fasciculata]|uniref:Exocyst complex component 2 n=1 Tax=Cavenderia fasciculata TaxID=261658 RepID=F4PGL2_CACFS|nr:exocyst complex subunit 2 [Cavenderia fasciculata]EGG24846.1 exocyst complex subunit 2 [Cavenderia fasciculata]|eukprot:XP_004362697.1 exocyst complex subunit 2 [Cavenderia fasciculata]
MSSSDSDSDSSYESDDELQEPTSWHQLKDGWQDFIVEDGAFIVPAEGSAAAAAESLQIEDSNRFNDPLGILKIPPRKSQGVKGHLISLESEQFDPVVFLSEIHSQTKFTELSVGLSKLKEASNSKDLEIKYLVKDNFEHFVKCKDTVDEVYNLITSSKMLDDMSGSFKKIIDKSEVVYDPLLQGKQEADHIRKVLTLLNKFKFIFKLPGKIQENIRNGEFDKVVHNYKYAKSVITTNNKKAFQRVLNDIEKMIEDFRSSMFASLRDPQSKPDYLKKVIRVLMEIGNGKGEWANAGDPCWYCLSHKNKAITTLISQCHDDQTLLHHKRIKRLSILLLSNIPNLYKMGRSYVEGRFDYGSEKFSSTITSGKKELALQQQLLGGTQKKKEKSISVIVHYLDETFSSYRIDNDKRVRDLVAMCMKRFTDPESEYCLYKLSEKKGKDSSSVGHIKLVELDPAESPYKIYKKWVSKGVSTRKFLFKKRSEEFSKNSQGKHVVQKDLNSTFKSHKKQYSAATSLLNEENFKKLIIELLQLYADKVQDLFFNDDDEVTATGQLAASSGGLSLDDEVVGSDTTNMVENVNEVIKCHDMLVGLGMPDPYVQSIKDLVGNLTLHFVNRICSEMVGEISFLYLLEDWSINDETKGVITANQIDGMVTTKLLNEFFNCTKSNLDKLSFLVNSPQLLKHVEKALCEAIESFGDCLHHLAFTNSSTSNTILLTNSIDNKDNNDQLVSDDEDNISSLASSTNQSSLNNSSMVPTIIDDIPKSTKLLLSLSNCSTVVSKTAIQLRDYYVTLFHRACSDRIKKVIQKMGSLELRILEEYVHLKSKPLCEAVHRGILYSGTDWSTNKPPTKVGDYVMTVLTKMVFIHNEVIKTINSLDVARGIITRILEKLLISFQFMHSQLDPTFLSVNGQMQLMLDILFLEHVLATNTNQKTEKISSALKQTLSLTPKDNYNRSQPINIKYLESIIESQLHKTSLLFNCFK